MVLEGETYFQALKPKPFVSISLPFARACKHHATETFGAKRVYIIVSSSISKTSSFTVLKDALGDSVVGVAADLRDLAADLIVTLGAGSLTDGAKVAALAAANGAFTLDALDKLHIGADPKHRAALQACTIPTINIPTSLSGGEYNASGGATDARNHRKAAFRHPSSGAQLVILDPALTVSTPERVWLSSGMRAVDHCVEGLCSSWFRPGEGESEGEDRRKAEVEAQLVKGLSLLLPNLLVTKSHPENLDARRSELLGVIEPFRAFQSGTSCVMLPSVLRWNRDHGDAWVVARQGKVLAVFWGDPTVADALKRRGLSRDTAGAGDVVAAFVDELGMPGCLRDVGVGRDQLEDLARNAMTDRDIPTNPVAIDRVE
ncbi:hypothetical protein B0T19DRAFT_451840 [Cercophora scortea]|uniref:Alcohol dehydrogenase iron-type/glycerol dehydrogenase GldA domain-containing protein n=1 Tax=Cercophora scortea TaxID=314031 RepID=A0AAE0M392_9PEZI|nr:hypothetical protein B0T19DRAFT_451840 [Cercophora scortea]